MEPLTRIAPGALTGPSDGRPERRGIDARELLTAAFKHARGMLWVAGATLALVILLVIVRGPVYRAEASILVKYGREYVYRPEIGEERPLIGLTSDEVLNSEVQILTSDELIRQVIEAVGIRTLYPPLLGATPSLDEAATRFRTALSADVVKRSSVVRVAFKHRDPRVAAETLHVLVARYRQKHLEVFSDTTVEFLEGKLGQYEEKLRDTERRLEAFRQRNGIFDYSEQMTLLLGRRSTLETTQRQARVELAELERQARSFKDALRSPRADAVYADVQKDVIRLEGEAESRRARIEGTAKVRDEVEGQIRRMDRSEKTLAMLRRELAQDERNYESYKAKVEVTRLASDLNAQRLANITVIDEGAVPTRPAPPGVALAIVLGVALALLSAAIYAFFAERFTERMSTPERAERRLGLPVLASVVHHARGPGGAT